MLDREWIIEERWSEGEYEQANTYLDDALDRFNSYHDSRARKDPWRADPWWNAKKYARKLKTDLKVKSHYEEWVPVYLFRPCINQLEPVPIFSYAASQIAKLVQTETRCTTLERCVELWREISGILKNKQLRIHNIYTGEVIPCEMFG